MRPYLITSTNDIPGKDRWVASLQRTLGDSVQPAIIMWEPHFAVPGDWIVRKMPQRYPGNLARFLPLLDMDLERDRWFLFTDTADVLFQAPLPALDQGEAKVLVAGEGERHDENDFWQPHLALPLFADLAAAPIYNAGTWAAVGHLFMHFVQSLSEMQEECRRHGWPVLQIYDQLIFNKWIQANRAFCAEMDTLFCTLYANYTGPRFNGRGEARLEEGRFVNRCGAPYAIVHANGSTKALLDRAAAPTVTCPNPLRGPLKSGE